MRNVQRGENMPKKILTIEDWKNILKLRKNNCTYDDIAKLYGVTKQCIQQGIEIKKRQYKELKYIFNY